MPESKTVYVFLDESGNLDFSRKGTLYYVLAAVVTERPLEVSQRLQKLKYMMLETGSDIEYFHASEDLQTTRNQVVSQIANMKNDVSVHYIHAQKTKTHPLYKIPPPFMASLV
ncbi:MAG TPA: DUF3800 domain-containing protein [Candidatus Saccharimonadales bacterium]|jgi:hypothetical protein